jgi:hypothetical protein
MLLLLLGPTTVSGMNEICAGHPYRIGMEAIGIEPATS